MSWQGGGVLAMLIVDGANVVGSVPDGWWRDRLGAARRLRDALVPVATTGLREAPGPVEVVLVVEGAAAPLAQEAPPTGVRVVAATPTGDGDDTIVDLVTAGRGRRCLVVTADRGLRGRVTAQGAEVLGPRTLPYGAGRSGRTGSAPGVVGEDPLDEVVGDGFVQGEP
jgi:hypothetical protein